MAQIVELKVPDIGGSKDVNLAEVYIKPGDKINKDDNLIMLETDKATMEVPASDAGIIVAVKLKVGDKVNEGDVIATLEVANPTNFTAETKSEQAALKESQEVSKSNLAKIETVAATTKPGPAIDEQAFNKAYASPSIRKLARELGVDLGKITGSGTNNRVTEEDVKAYVKGIINKEVTAAGITSGLNLLPWPKVDFAKFGPIEAKPLSRIKKISGANLARNWAMIPHVTQFDEADISALEEFRQQLNTEYKKAEIKITPLAFLIKACVFALQRFPEFNASLEEDNLIYKHYYNIGFAADTPQGLVVPVLKEANSKGVIELAQESSALAKLAREGKLKPSDMQGGTFTISSLGGIGGTAFTPIINAPEVAILGVSKSSIKPLWNGKEFTPRLILPLSLSYDHRIIDGALAAKFTSYLAQILADIRRLVL